MENKETINIAVNKIIEEQEAIIGPLARELASKTTGIKETKEGFEVEIDYKEAITNLSDTYRDIFGDIALQVTQDILIKYKLKVALK